MLKIILGVIVGFIVWSILWIGSDALLMAILPWYGKHQTDFNVAMTTGQPFLADTTILIMHLIRSIIVSIISGLVAAVIARENTKTTLILGILLLAFGIFVQALAWNNIPVWYHVIFLALIIPMTVFGGKLRKSQ